MTSLPPLLALASGRKVRPRKPPGWRPREIKLHCCVADLLASHCVAEWLWTHINRKAKDAREGAILKKMGCRNGWPDFLLLSPHCVFHGLELKRAGEELTEGQEEFRAWVLSHGGEYEVARTIDVVLDVLGRWGCLRVEVAARAHADDLVMVGERE
jgi:hypothetical protein